MSKPLKLIWDIRPPSPDVQVRIIKNVFGGLIKDLISERSPKSETPLPLSGETHQETGFERGSEGGSPSFAGTVGRLTSSIEIVAHVPQSDKEKLACSKKQ